ncbi:MAG: hypothetical protein RLZZ168_1153 [Cyanobacteriota bacterium]|jgi:hypothetical protein
MPTVLRSGPYRLYFYSHEPNEPPHIHVDRGEASCKFWLSPVALASNLGFRPKELRTIETIVMANLSSLTKAWREFHG